MGCFSWKDCKTEKAIRIRERAFALVPKEFGTNIKENCYDGYGNFGGYDIYELVADWNKNYITINNLLLPKAKDKSYYYPALYDFEREEFRKEGKSEEEIQAIEDEKATERFNNSVRCYNFCVNRLNDFVKGTSEDDMREKYGRDYKREIGIDIACYDEQNRALKYPIKISHSDLKYEECEASLGDPNQGF